MSASRRSRLLQRRSMVLALAGAALGGQAFGRPLAKVPIQVWKDPNCGCCQDWIVHLQQHGFEVTVFDEGNAAARARLGMPRQLGSCHTALVLSYVVEGHVPAADIRRLIAERPVALGLAVPGMPVGSPGMDGPAYGNRKDSYDVLMVQRNGSYAVFNSYR